MDIKPENIMFDNEGANGVLKVGCCQHAVMVTGHDYVNKPYRSFMDLFCMNRPTATHSLLADLPYSCTCFKGQWEQYIEK